MSCKQIISELPLIAIALFLGYVYLYNGFKVLNAKKSPPISVLHRRHKEKAPMAKTMHLTSSNFNNNESIPATYTCDGANVSPQLSWDKVPEGTQSFALICDDPDAPKGTWVHWVLYNLPPSVTSLNEGIPTDALLINGGRQGINSFNNVGYGGACPPHGHGEHRYVFKIYALKIALDNLPAGTTTKEDLEAAIEGNLLGYGELIGTYKRD